MMPVGIWKRKESATSWEVLVINKTKISNLCLSKFNRYSIYYWTIFKNKITSKRYAIINNSKQTLYIDFIQLHCMYMTSVHNCVRNTTYTHPHSTVLHSWLDSTVRKIACIALCRLRVLYTIININILSKHSMWLSYTTWDYTSDWNRKLC